MLVPRPKKEVNKRKIILILLTIFIIAVFILIGSRKIASNQNSSLVSPKQVKGISVQADEIKNAVQDKINALQEEASNINVAEVASSSPQVQKVINDIKSVENYPSDQAKSFCEQVCSGL